MVINMDYPKILYWKWDDSHLQGDKYLQEIDDIVKRSCFDTIYITTHWCHQGISTDILHEKIQKAAEAIHRKGRKIILEIDSRAEKAQFVKQYPNARTGFTYGATVETGADGWGAADLPIAAGGGELFLGNRQSGEEVLFACSYDTDDSGIRLDSVRDITGLAKLERTDNRNIRVCVKNPYRNKMFVLVCSWLDFPDFWSLENRVFFDGLFERFQNIPLDGTAVDELGFPWHPDFNFAPNSYMRWNDSMIFTKCMQKYYRDVLKRDLFSDFFQILAEEKATPGKIAAINTYYEEIRKCISGQESYFYGKSKSTFGKNTFVGVHPTWYAIEEVDNTPEVWKNGIDWWEVKRDYGFTDEIMLYPVRLALTHKSGGNIFYNMWYGESTNQTETFYPEMYRNARYGGRTISLSYECLNETGNVVQLKEGDGLERVSAIEERISLLDKVQKAPPASDILVIMGIPACCNVLVNQDGNGKWNAFQSVFTESFTLARDIWISGYNCDLVGSYEIENGSIAIAEDGFVTYAGHRFRLAIFAFPEFSKRSVLEFLRDLGHSKTGSAVIGTMRYDFYGKDVSKEFAEIRQELPCFGGRPAAGDLYPLFEQFQVEKYRVPCGSILEDGTVILTAPSPEQPVGNRFMTTFRYNGYQFDFDGEDIGVITFDREGRFSEICCRKIHHFTYRKLE